MPRCARFAAGSHEGAANGAQATSRRRPLWSHAVLVLVATVRIRPRSSEVVFKSNPNVRLCRMLDGRSVPRIGQGLAERLGRCRVAVTTL